MFPDFQLNKKICLPGIRGRASVRVFFDDYTFYICKSIRGSELCKFCHRAMRVRADHMLPWFLSPHRLVCGEFPLQWTNYTCSPGGGLQRNITEMTTLQSGLQLSAVEENQGFRLLKVKGPDPMLYRPNYQRGNINPP